MDISGLLLLLLLLPILLLLTIIIIINKHWGGGGGVKSGGTDPTFLPGSSSSIDYTKVISGRLYLTPHTLLFVTMYLTPNTSYFR